MSAHLPWLAHLYTASGAALALVATVEIFDGRFRAAFIALGAALVVDATDGWLARALRVQERLPGFDGARLDDIVDYLTYVFVPVLLVRQAGLLPAGWDLPVGAAVLAASAYGFARTDAKVKTTDYFFTGFPSYWNLVALYLFVWRLPPAVNAALLLALAVLVFVPFGYVYPSRTRALRRTTLLFSAVWAGQLALMVWRLPQSGGPLMWASLAFPAYYLVLSVYLNLRDTR